MAGAAGAAEEGIDELAEVAVERVPEHKIGREDSMPVVLLPIDEDIDRPVCVQAEPEPERVSWNAIQQGHGDAAEMVVVGRIHL